MFTTRSVAGIKSHAFFKGVDWTALAARAVPAPLAVRTEGPLDVSHFDAYFTAQPVHTGYDMLTPAALAAQVMLLVQYACV
jgi:hypothetical protein